VSGSINKVRNTTTWYDVEHIEITTGERGGRIWVLKLSCGHTVFRAEYLLYVFITSQLFLCGSPQKNVGALFAIQVHNKAFLRPQTAYHWINHPLQRSFLNAKFIFHSFYFKSVIKDGILFSLFDA
jgi:hypothetical protein